MKKVGLLIPKTNLTVEYELQCLFNSGFFSSDKVVFYTSKLDYKTSYKEKKEQYLKDLAIDSKNKINDLKYLNVDYISFFCTSSAIINFEKVIENNPATALIESANQNEIKKCLLITPYNDELGNKVKNELEKNNIVVNRILNLNLLNTLDYFDFGINKLEKFILDNYKDDDENIIISCTNLPTLTIIDNLRNKLNTKIISSNSSLFEKIKKDIN